MYIKWKELDQVVLLKELFNKRVPLFDKRAFRQFRLTGGGWIPSNQNLFLESSNYIKKNILLQKKHF